MCSTIKKLKDLKYKVRKPNFPEAISEYLVQKITNGTKPRSGDLKVNNKKIEVKCIASTGPTSFGPKESWGWIVFVYAVDYPKITFYFYNTSKMWLNIKINSKDTFETQIKQKRRPRINFSELKSKLPKPDIILKYDIMDVLCDNIQKIKI